MPSIERGGVRIFHQMSGAWTPPGAGLPGAGLPGPPPGALPVLLSHGFGETSDMWAPNLPALASGRGVITWDMRGHGRSDSPASQDQYTHAECVADMAAVLDAHGVQRAVVGGLSLGGYLSLAFWLACPGRVAALILCATGPGFRSDTARQTWNDRAAATAVRLERDGRPGLARAARGLLAQRDASVIDALPSVDVPVLVLVGDRDAGFRAAADYVSAKVPCAVTQVIPGAGHLCNADAPAEFNAAVLDFLGRLDS